MDFIPGATCVEAEGTASNEDLLNTHWETIIDSFRNYITTEICLNQTFQQKYLYYPTWSSVPTIIMPFKNKTESESEQGAERFTMLERALS